MKNEKVICALSGGVDKVVLLPTAYAYDCEKNLKCVMVNTSLMRKDEFKFTYQIFKKI